MRYGLLNRAGSFFSPTTANDGQRRPTTANDGKFFLFTPCTSFYSTLKNSILTIPVNLQNGDFAE
jgi:hypothetical protein